MALASGMQGCIHEYPGTPAHDPTRVRLAVEINAPPPWTEVTKGADPPLRRIVVEAFRNGVSAGRLEFSITPEEYASGHITRELPFSLHAVEYRLVAWADIVSHDTSGNLRTYYNTTELSEIIPLSPLSPWNDAADCAFASVSLDLRKYRGKWDSKVIVPLPLSRPLARFVLSATDIDDFMEYTACDRSRGETYTVSLTSDSQTGRAFDAYSGLPSHPGLLPASSSPLTLPSTGHPPGQPFPICSGAIFTGETEEETSLSVAVHNSARILISRSPSLKIPLVRGSTTHAQAEMLTGFVYNAINVNNIWDGEIIIEIE